MEVSLDGGATWDLAELSHLPPTPAGRHWCAARARDFPRRSCAFPVLGPLAPDCRRVCEPFAGPRGGPGQALDALGALSLCLTLSLFLSRLYNTYNRLYNMYNCGRCWTHWELRVPVAALLAAAGGDVRVRAWDSGNNTQPDRLTWNVMGMGALPRPPLNPPLPPPPPPHF